MRASLLSTLCRKKPHQTTAHELFIDKAVFKFSSCVKSRFSCISVSWFNLEDTLAAFLFKVLLSLWFAHWDSEDLRFIWDERFS